MTRHGRRPRPARSPRPGADRGRRAYGARGARRHAVRGRLAGRRRGQRPAGARPRRREPVRGRAVGHRHARHRRRPAPAGDPRARPRRARPADHRPPPRGHGRGGARARGPPLPPEAGPGAGSPVGRGERGAAPPDGAAQARGAGRDRTWRTGCRRDRAGLETRFQQRARHAAAGLPAHRARGGRHRLRLRGPDPHGRAQHSQPGRALRGGRAAGARPRGGRRGAGPRRGVPGPRRPR